LRWPRRCIRNLAACIARELLVIAERIDVTAGKSVTRSEIAARARARRQKQRCRAGSEQWSRYLFAQVAAAWLRFPGILEDPPHSERNAFYARYSHFVMWRSKTATWPGRPPSALRDTYPPAPHHPSKVVHNI
jgi:hypothetical protein